MPPKHGRGCGGKRGGRGLGGSGSFAPFRLSKSSRRRSRKRGLSELPSPGDTAEDGGMPSVNRGPAPNTPLMRSLSKRPYWNKKSMMREARYTDRHVEQTMSLALRHWPVEFIKAETKYDPSKDIVEKLLQRCEAARDEKRELLCKESEPREVEAAGDDVDGGEVPVEEMIENEQESGSGAAEVGAEAEVVTASEVVAEVEIDATGTDSKIQDAEMAEMEEVREEHIPLVEAEAELDEEVSSGDETETFDEIQFSIDTHGDSGDIHVPKANTAALLCQRPPKAPSPSFTSAFLVELCIKFGNLLLPMEFGDDGSASVVFADRKRTKAKSGYASLRSSINEPFAQEGAHSAASCFESDMETALEDYMAQLMANDTSDSDNDTENDDYIESVSIPSHSSHDYRARNDGVERTHSSQFDDIELLDFIDLDIDDDSEPDSDEEGLEDILAFARQHQRLAEMDITNAVPQKVGKGRKQRLELGSELEIELRESLMEQFQYQKASRRLKKLRKKEKKRQETLEQLHFLEKYEYSLHIQEIKHDFELFLHDADRLTLIFPPLDPYGHKTLSKLAKHYNMKCSRCGGNDSSLYMKICKTKKTFRYVPDYALIEYIMKQRPVFLRADVKSRPQTEAVVGKTGRSNAYVREGEVVGALAPEIGHNNIGRKMLEMLGWSRGEGLGALGNKGISMPVLATVKKSKAGLK
ncbi:hypothetical protein METBISCDRAFT_25776 [Metschnikowia bicuspidata]|uniref:G-patch domain-containing protein n=1 Tax=Metschnikowia bicuspidata TaxID=27322 RepID=A0A4P9ZH46_9ASCO|nr:hypothetical protein METBISCDRAFT_25776 [Metschnikowia bicuspidata]